MQGLIEYVKQYWMLFVILIVAIIAFLFVFSKASKAVGRTREEKEKLMKKLDRLKKIREKYSSLSAEIIMSDSGEDLLEGVADNIQRRLEKAEDMNTAFEKLNEEEKIVYAFNYFLEEAVIGASEFFKSYTKPLTPYALISCKEFCDNDLYRLIKEEYNAYDEDNENASVIKEEIEKTDEKIQSKLDIEKLKINAANFIKTNCSKFV